MTSGERLSDSLKEKIESILWMNDGTQPIVLTHNNAAIESVMDSISGFQHRTIAGELSVRVN